MSVEHSPWLRKRVPRDHPPWRTCWVDVRGRGWVQVECLSGHFTIPKKATRIRFVRGKYVDSLCLLARGGNYWKVTGHRKKSLDADEVRMLYPFVDWWGVSASGWHWVEWK